MAENQVAQVPGGRRRNYLIWAGFVVVLIALMSYIPFFALFPITRDTAWANLLLFVAGGWLVGVGLSRAFRKPEVYRGKIAGSILGVVTLLMFGLFCFGAFVAARAIPDRSSALPAGQPAPGFTLASADGKSVVLSDLLKNHRAVVLIFYRGYW